MTIRGRQGPPHWQRDRSADPSVQIPTYGVLAHSIRTSTMDTGKFEENRTQIPEDNRPFRPRADIERVEWLTRDTSVKTTATFAIEFTKPEDADEIVDEDLIWQSSKQTAHVRETVEAIHKAMDKTVQQTRPSNRSKVEGRKNAK
ncbi:hypothetical protein BU26DRAFT_560213 [Trematosphaeria pertusa]|uniref:Uncharacterized protein n=1 Tax=Trematosphaeria pertusa TaxID=390896 RepID=A0A6A6IS23_9PLEO|nr:uncharacterized protein BU26DRAFT_560213 [Trematosphaeria pertusa]KAF2252868.1 hypothetical protein BU26DRAFT_560213 [Trematosphaeria pertusa]